MARNDPSDFFETDSDPFDDDAPTRWGRALQEPGRGAGGEELPWEPRQVSLYKTIFPQMTNWLPEDEAAQLRFDFESELVRLNAA
jgi:hypothetical protein